MFVFLGVLGTAGIAKGCTIPGMQLAELDKIAREKEEREKLKRELGMATEAEHNQR